MRRYCLTLLLALAGAGCGDSELSRDMEICDDELDNDRDNRVDCLDSDCFDICECGNGVIEPGEECDGAALNDATCADFGFDTGLVLCTATCKVNRSLCSRCGDGVVSGGEVCDTADLAGATCSTSGYNFTSGTLTCTGACTYDTLQCGGYDPVNDGILGPLEPCDLDLFALGASCADYNLGAGQVACTAAGRLDFSGCANPDYCTANGAYDNGLCDACEVIGGAPDPECDALCGADGFCAYAFNIVTGVVACWERGTPDPDCDCGNGVQDFNQDAIATEICDGGDLGGFNCQGHFLKNGVIRCKEDCTPDLSGCRPPDEDE